MNLCFTETIKDFPNYLVCRDGRVTNIKTGKFLKSFPHRDGYEIIFLYNSSNKSRKTLYLHRVMAEAFIHNPENMPQVNHKNGIKNDNRLENFEWTDNSGNQKHSFRELGRKHLHMKKGFSNPQSISIKQYSLDGKLIKEFGSMREAERETNCFRANIRNVINKKSKSTGGYKWSL